MNTVYNTIHQKPKQRMNEKTKQKKKTNCGRKKHIKPKINYTQCVCVYTNI